MSIGFRVGFHLFCHWTLVITGLKLWILCVWGRRAGVTCDFLTGWWTVVYTDDKRGGEAYDLVRSLDIWMMSRRTAHHRCAYPTATTMPKLCSYCQPSGGIQLFIFRPSVCLAHGAFTVTAPPPPPTQMTDGGVWPRCHVTQRKWRPTDRKPWLPTSGAAATARLVDGVRTGSS